MASSTKDKVDRLVKAGLLEMPVHPDVEAKIGALSDAEIGELISIRHKLGLSGKLNVGPALCGF